MDHSLLHKTPLQIRQEQTKKIFDQYKIRQNFLNFKNNLKNNLLYGHKNNLLNCGLMMGNMNTGAYREIGLLPDLEFDFSSAMGWTTSDSARVNVDTGNSEVDYNASDTSTDFSDLYYDVGAGLISDTLWEMRFELEMLNITSGGDNTQNVFYIGLTSLAAGKSNQNQDAIYSKIAISNSAQVLTTRDVDGSQPALTPDDITLAQAPSVTTRHCKLKRTSSTGYSFGIYPDNTYTTPDEEDTGTVSATSVGYRYINLMTENYDGTADSSNNGNIRNLKLWYDSNP